MTEDMDLSYRAQLAGWRTLYLPDVDAPAELPAQMEAFKRQQARWAQGSVQCLRKLTPRHPAQRPALAPEADGARARQRLSQPAADRAPAADAAAAALDRGKRRPLPDRGGVRQRRAAAVVRRGAGRPLSRLEAALPLPARAPCGGRGDDVEHDAGGVAGPDDVGRRVQADAEVPARGALGRVERERVPARAPIGRSWAKSRFSCMLWSPLASRSCAASTPRSRS